jgi:hypothetical protein
LRTIAADAKANPILPNSDSLADSTPESTRKIDKNKPKITNWEKAALRVEVLVTASRTHQGRDSVGVSSIGNRSQGDLAGVMVLV